MAYLAILFVCAVLAGVVPAVLCYLFFRGADDGDDDRVDEEQPRLPESVPLADLVEQQPVCSSSKGVWVRELACA